MATQSSIKHTQLTRVGYTYQDLICIRILIDWFHDPDKYQWVSVEGNRDLGILKSLDDVICFTQDGKYELYQVKFTIDSERDDLTISFDWLLDKQNRGSSLLEKWLKDIEKFESDGGISVAKLITNRKPDSVFGKCLDGKRVKYELIPDEIKKAILRQVKEDSARVFFDTLIFEHSQSEIDDLGNQLHDSLVPDHSGVEGWLQFQRAVERWATRKNEPAPDGRIRLHHIREVLSLGTKRTISQFFEIPGGYIPPLEEFHTDVLGKTEVPGSWVISGSPGMGKSTYLSYLTDRLIEHGRPVIRHHYSLSAQSISDRISYPNAARSLQGQLKNLYPDNFNTDHLDPERLESWVDQAVGLASNDGGPLVVVIDGLDHVYRERSDISQLEHLVNRLDKFKDKICLIYGTQPVSDRYLPASLLSSAPRESAWIEIPPMGLEPIKAWVDYLGRIGSLNIIGEGEHQRNEVVEISRTLREISSGYPLHVIYSVNSLSLLDKAITKYDVERLPRCPKGDIHTYYETLWVSLSDGAKEILMLIANAEFSWPDDTHLGYCFDEGLAFRNSFGEIQHLIEQRLSGISPFHGSLLVFLRNKDSFKSAVTRLNEKSNEWLKTKAPEYWKWGWEWIVQANLGNHQLLLSGLTRDWLIQSLCVGYPLENIEHIFVYAENIAFREKLYSELVRLRILKTRLLNGPEFQIQKFDDFLDCSFRCTSNNFGLRWRADNLRIIDGDEIVVVAKNFQGKNARIVSSCEEEIYRRIRFYARIGDSDHYRVLGGLIDGYLEVLISNSEPDLRKIKDFYERLDDKESSLRRIVELLIENGHRHLILDIFDFGVPQGIIPYVVDEVVLAASLESIPPKEIIAEEQLKKSNIGQVRSFLDFGELEVNSLLEPELPKGIEHPIDHIFSEYFWYHTAKYLHLSEVESEPNYVHSQSIEEYIEKAGEFFKYAANAIASRLKARENDHLIELYHYFDALEYPEGYSLGYRAAAMCFSIKKAIASIGIQLSILAGSTERFENIKEFDFSRLSSSKWWEFRVICDLILKNSISSFPAHLCAREMSELYELEVLKRDNTSSLANESLELGMMAVKLGDLDNAQKYLHRSATNIVGYGWRKDITFHEVFEAIEECSNANCAEVPGWLERVATFTNDVFVFSEREIRHIPRWFTTLLAKHMPERLVDEYDYHLSEENWDRANLILESIVESFPLSEPIEHSFLHCMTTYVAMNKLGERANSDEILKNVYKEQCDLLGGLPPKPKESPSSTEEESGELPEVSEYAPNDAKKFREALNKISYRSTDDFTARWIAYWEDQGHGKTVLQTFDLHYQSSVSDMTLDRCLPAFYSLSKKLQGKKSAYKWAVRDVILNDCWGGFSRSHAKKSLVEYATAYKSNWEKFLQDTTQPGSSRYGNSDTVIVPSSNLVVYFIAAGQLKLATEITEMMVKSLEGDISHLPLSKPYWYEAPVPRGQVMGHLLLLHYNWPDRYSRLLTAKQIAQTLSNDGDGFRELYLEYLSYQSYEVEVVDLLSILYLIELQPFSKEELIEHINYPSVLTDEILENIGLYDEERKDWSGLYSLFRDDAIPNIEKYSRYANGLAQRYIHVIEVLGQNRKFDLVRHMVLEWESILDRKQCCVFDPYDFCGDQFYRQDRIGCAFSWPAEVSILSAFLRTLAYACAQHDLPFEETLYLAQEVSPFGEAISSIAPASKPEDWPILENFKEGDELPDESWLASHLQKISRNEQLVLRANGPILQDYRGVCCDLKIIVVSLHKSKLSKPEDMFESIGRARNVEDKVFTVASERYPASFGRWGVDWLMRGYFRPSYSIGDSPFNSISHQEKCIEYFGGSISNGVWRYWIDQWYPAHHSGVGGSIGTYFTVSREIFAALRSQSEGDFNIIAELTCVDRRGYGSDKKASKVYAIESI